MLQNSALTDVAWNELTPSLPFYLFKTQEQEVRKEYDEFTRITDVFPVNVLGFQTHRDNFALDFDENMLRHRIMQLRDGSWNEDEFRSRYSLGNWDVNRAQARLRSDLHWETAITKCLYRPFDMRPCYYSDIVIDRPRRELIRNILNRENLALNLVRQTRSDTWQHAVVSNLPTPAVYVEIKDGSNVFPLYIYPTEKEAAIGMEKQANLAPAFVAEIAAIVGDTPTPEAIFHYAYAVFHAPTYRTRYAEFLKIDFPRLPLPPDSETFHVLAALGAKLVALHLLESPSLNRHGIGYPVAGDHHVVKMRPIDRYQLPTLLDDNPHNDGKPLTGRVRLNDTEYFENVPQSAWEFRVGGYQPAAKWLDDRADRVLTEADITHYQRMIAALRDTSALLPDVDAAFVRLLPIEE